MYKQLALYKQDNSKLLSHLFWENVLSKNTQNAVRGYLFSCPTSFFKKNNTKTNQTKQTPNKPTTQQQSKQTKKHN